MRYTFAVDQPSTGLSGDTLICMDNPSSHLLMESMFGSSGVKRWERVVWVIVLA
jgi:hypothetical protein